MMTSVLIFWLFGALQSVSAQDYIHVWPLGNSTCGYDVMTGNDARYPPMNACLVPIGSQHPALPYASLTLTGLVFFDLPVTANTKYDDVSFTVNLRPWELSGTLLHYTSPQPCYKCIWDLRVDLQTDGTLAVTFYADGMNQAETKNIPSVTLTRNEWNYLAIGTDAHSGEIIAVQETYGGTTVEDYVIFDTVDHAHLDGSQRTLRIGARSDGTNSFRGDVACASVLRLVTEPQYAVSIAECAGAWNKTPSAAPVFSTTADWVLPTYDINAGYDVIQNVSRRHHHSGKDLRVDPNLTSLGYGSLYMDGSPLSTMDLNFNPLILQTDFTLTFYVRAFAPGLGALAHVRTSTRSGAGIQDVVISVGMSYVMARFSDGRGAVCGEVTVQRSNPTVPTWDVIGLGRKGARIFVMSGMDWAHVNHSCAADLSGNGTGLLRLGGSFDDVEGFHGNLGCFVLFKKFAGSAVSTLNACSVPHTAPQGGKPRSLKSQSVVIIQKNAEPAASMVSGSQLTSGSEFKVRSLLACATECCKTLHCRSFTVTSVKGSAGDKYCQLFDFLTLDSLQGKAGTHYYALTLSSTF